MPLLRRRWALRARKAAFNDAAVAAQTKTSERATPAKQERHTGDAAVGQGQVGLGEVRTEGSGSSVALSRRSQAANVRSQLSG